jgi:hypothetical protein
MDLLNLSGRRQNKPRLYVLWTEDYMKTVAVEQVEDGAKKMFKMDLVFFLSGERMQLVTWGKHLSIFGL